MIDTLYFVLKSDREKFAFKSNEILEQIYEQKCNFIKKFGYEPKYINIPDDLNNYLYEQLIDNVVNVEKNYDYSPKTVYGMILKSRFKDSILNDNEFLCI